MSYGGLKQVADLYNETASSTAKTPGRLMCSYFHALLRHRPRRRKYSADRQIRLLQGVRDPGAAGRVPKTAPPDYPISSTW